MKRFIQVFNSLVGIMAIAFLFSQFANATVEVIIHDLEQASKKAAVTLSTNNIDQGKVLGVTNEVVLAATTPIPCADCDTPTYYTLTVAKTGSGTVTSSPVEINCGSTCSAIYTSGVAVTLTATPASGFVFSGWGGVCSGTGSCTLTMNSNKNVTATFGTATKLVTLNIARITSPAYGTVTSSPAGINCGDICGAVFPVGTAVTLKASPGQGYIFTGWRGCQPEGLQLTCTVTLNSDTTVSANFATNTFSIDVYKTGTGSGTIVSSPVGINCGSDCNSATFKGTPGSSVTFTATAVAGSKFLGWGGACIGNQTSCTVILADRPTNHYPRVMANFIPTDVPLADLIITSVEIKGIPKVGDFGINGWVTIKNQGSGTAKFQVPVGTEHYFAPSILNVSVFKSQLASDYVMVAGSGPAAVSTGDGTIIAPGESKEYDFFTMTDSRLYTRDDFLGTAGEKTLYFMVDIENLVSESDIINNIYTKKFTVSATTSSISLITPKSGEVWRIGSTYTIQWQNSDVAPTTRSVQLYTNPVGSATVCLIANSVPDRGSYTWTIPTTIDRNCWGTHVLTVLRLDGSNIKGQSEVFTISSTPSSMFKIAEISTFAPSYVPGANVNFKVRGIEPDGTATAYEEGFRVSGQIYFGSEPYTPASPQTVSYEPTGWWQLTLIAPSSNGSYKMRVVLSCSFDTGVACAEKYGTGGPQVEQMVPFMVGTTSSGINIITPNGGERWVVDKTYTIGWSTKGVPTSYYNSYPLIELVSGDSSDSAVLTNWRSQDKFANSDDSRFGRTSFTVSKTLAGKNFYVRVSVGDNTGGLSFRGTTAGQVTVVTSPPWRVCAGSPEMVRRSALGTDEFGRLGLDISSHPEILRYRIQWFSGGWSDWYIPGVDDVDWKTDDITKPHRVWAYFGDHNHEFEKCSTTVGNKPDFIVEDINVVNRSTSGEKVFSVRYKNIGSIALAQMLTVELVDTDTGDIYSQSIGGGDIPSGFSYDLEMAQAIREQTRARFYVKAKVDSTNKFVESNENNNELTKTISFTPVTSGKIIDDSKADNDPVLLRRSNGDLIVVYTSEQAGANIGAAYSKISKDNGKTWQGPYKIVDSWGKIDLIENISKQLVVIATDLTPGRIGGGSVTLVSIDGVTWTNQRPVTVTSLNDGYGSIEQSSDGSYYVTFNVSSGVWQSYITKSTDLITWEAAWPVSVDGAPIYGSSIMQASDGTYYLVGYTSVLADESTITPALVALRSTDVKNWVKDNSVNILAHSTMGQHMIEMQGIPTLFYAFDPAFGQARLYYASKKSSWNSPQVAAHGPFPFGVSSVVMSDGSVAIAYMKEVNGQRDIFFQNIGGLIVGGTPDLVVSSISLEPSVPVVGQEVIIKAVVKNIGTVDAFILNSQPLSGPTANLKISGFGYNYVEGTGGAIGTNDNPPIKPGSTATYIFGKHSTIKLSNIGPYSISVTADGGSSDAGGIGVIDESNEGNNTLVKTIIVDNKKVDLKSISAEESVQQRIQQLEYKVSELERQLVENEKQLAQKIDQQLTNRVAGKILLQVEGNGEAWYVDKDTQKKFYLKDGNTAYTALQAFGLGISNENLAKIPVSTSEQVVAKDSDGDGLDDQFETAIGTNPMNKDTDNDGYDDGMEISSGYSPLGPGKTTVDASLVKRLEGKIILAVNKHGEAFYISNGIAHYLKDGASAYQIMRNQSLGITNNDLRKIQVGEFE
ncbi:MAG: CARDB domain-containing protein [Patescibacteria group bacterium]